MRTIHGRGSHGRVIFDAIAALEPNPQVRWTDDSEGTRPKPHESFICGIGDNRTRRSIGGTMTVIHPSATISRTAEIGLGTFVGANAFIGPMAKIGRGVIVNTGAIVEHECVVGDFVHVASNATLSGKSTVGEGALIGAGATVRFGQGVGDWATVGCGACVVKDVPPGETWVGVPARRHQC